MNILFICGSAEPGKDGVGDYTRRLAGELIRLGHQATLLSLCDKEVVNFINTTQNIDNIEVVVKRMPQKSSLKQKQAWTQEILKDNIFDFISLQYVPYSFHPKGMPFWLPKFVKQIKAKHQFHIMFHEIWIGISSISPLKHKITGIFQRRIAKKLANNIKINCISTSNLLYQKALQNAGIASEILSLFSNIPKHSIDAKLNESLEKKLGIHNKKQIDYLFVGVFGSIYPDANLKQAILDIQKSNQVHKKQIYFVNFGREGAVAKKKIADLKTEFNNEILFKSLGEQPEKMVSALLQLMDVMISCTPFQHLGKSGVFAALKLHGVKVVYSCRQYLPEFLDIEQKFNQFINRPPEMWSVEFVTNDFIKLLNKTTND